MPIHIVIDDRELRSGVIDVLQQQAEVVLEVARLSTGDYLVENRFLFERKTLDDLFLSIIDGRLFSQAARMAEHPSPVIVLEGCCKFNSDISRHAVQGALITISLFYGIPLLRSKNAAETAYLLTCCGTQYRRQLASYCKRGGYHPKKELKQKLFILQGIPGVGPEKAKLLLAHFGSVENVFKATEKQLALVGGIGKKLASQIRHLLTD